MEAELLKKAFKYDVITLGETMVRLTPPDRKRLEQAAELQVHVGGSESNTAVGLARLGQRTAWLSRLPNTSLGRIVSGELSRHGVDISHVAWCDEGRLGLYFLEEAGPPRGSQIIYDRRNSAASQMTPDDLPVSLFTSRAFRVFHTTGITLAISESARATAMRAAQLTQEADRIISFDVNHRSRLWSSEEAKAACDAILKLAHLVFLPDRDAETLFGVPARSDPELALKQLATRYRQATWIMTLGNRGSIAYESGNTFTQGIYASDEVGRLGGGDAFSAGFLARYLETDGDVRDSLQWAAATAAIKYSIPGDLPILSRNEVQSVVASGASHAIRR